MTERDTPISAHLSRGELECRDANRTPYPAKWLIERALPLAVAFEAIRAACGNQPIAILSAYRTPVHNKKIGGARLSQHVQGRALDLRPPDPMTVKELFDVIRGLANSTVPSIRGIGLYPALRQGSRGFVHFDIRPSVRLVIWTHGARAQADEA